MDVPASRDALDAICSKAADLLMTHRWKMWFWGDSIGLEGLLDASRITGNSKYLGFVYGFLKGWMARMEHRSRFDHTAAGAALLSCYELIHDEALLEGASVLSDYLSGFRRTSDGCYLHYEHAHFELPPELPPSHPAYDKEQERQRFELAVKVGGPCVFVDSVHFHGPFFAKMYALTRLERYRQLALDHIAGQVRLVWDELHHLFHHFWIEETRQRNSIFWGRGNGWGMLGILYTVEHLRESDPEAQHLLQIFRFQAERLKQLQDQSGDWRTVLDDRNSYLESSIAAFVVTGFSLALERGWIGEEYESTLEQAWRAMWSHIDESGLFKDVSFETFPSLNREHYRKMPQGAMVPWGQGPCLMAVHGYLKYKGQLISSD